jgi:hypothetical protein
MPLWHRNCTTRSRAGLAGVSLLLAAFAPVAARAAITVFQAQVTPTSVVYTVGADSSGVLDVYHDRATPPGAGAHGDASAAVSAATAVTFTWPNVPDGIYRSYVQHRVNPSDSSEVGQVVGPLEVVVGPDLIFCPLPSGQPDVTCSLAGNLMHWTARVCNVGGRSAGTFRVGFWWDSPTPPAVGSREDLFASVNGLPPIWDVDTWPPCYDDSGPWGSFVPYLLCADRGEQPQCCPEVTVTSEPLSNKLYNSWAMVDSADFQSEPNEQNNLAGPYSIDLALPDLAVKVFSATITAGAISYRVTVCNVGTAKAQQFYVDVYSNRKTAPRIGTPGDLIQSVPSLAPDACVDLTFLRPGAADGVYQSWVLADADGYLVEPDTVNNRSGPLEVKVVAGDYCVDADGDGFGVGGACTGPQDCDDSDPAVHPRAAEICGNGKDDNCNLTVDDGCPGVDCADLDGDGWPTGPDCVVQDCNDSDPEVYPHAAEVCGDGKDNDCNGIVDDGCPGRACVDRDQDGYGVGDGCPGPQDCDDRDPHTHPGAPEICGDGKDNNCNGIVDDGCAGCVDDDGDGYGVGDGCGPLLQRDCDDNDPLTHPGAPEICGDHKDNNCNFSVDDGCPSVDCSDQDGDGWPAGPDCNQGWVDPDDDDPTTYPGATEICGDGKDNNANGTVDDGCPGVQCFDLDGDNWPAGPDCNQEYVDCDDDDVSVHPKRRGGEICGDGIDNDCNGVIDDGCRTCEDRDKDGFFSGPDCPLTTPQDCDDSDSRIYPGARVHAAGGKDSNCDGVISQEERASAGGACDCGGGGAATDGGADRVMVLSLLAFGAFGRLQQPRRRPRREHEPTEWS